MTKGKVITTFTDNNLEFFLPAWSQEYFVKENREKVVERREEAMPHYFARIMALTWRLRASAPVVCSALYKTMERPSEPIETSTPSSRLQFNTPTDEAHL